MYGLLFTAAASRYELRAGGRNTATLYRCDASCSEVASVPASFGKTGTVVSAALPGDAFGAGTRLSGLRAYAAVGVVASGPVSALDTVELPDADILPVSVEVEVAAPGTREGEAEFAPAAVSGGRFARELPGRSGRASPAKHTLF